MRADIVKEHHNKRLKAMRRALKIPEKNMYMRNFVIWI